MKENLKCVQKHETEPSNVVSFANGGQVDEVLFQGNDSKILDNFTVQSSELNGRYKIVGKIGEGMYAFCR